MGFLTDLTYSHLFFTPPLPTTKVTAQTIVVTGSKCGLGLEAARHFVRLDAAKVILAVRNTDKGNTAKASIEASEKRTGVLEVWHLDLASYDSVKAFAQKCETLERLVVMMENAGISTWKYVRCEEDESTITVNVVSTFLLALLVLPKTRETAQRFNVVPRLSIVASFVQWLTKFPQGKEGHIFDTISDPNTNMNDMYVAMLFAPSIPPLTPVPPINSYIISILLDIYATRSLAALISASRKEPAIIVNCLNPGWVITEVLREWTGLRLFAYKIACTLFARKTDVGARTLVAAAAAGEESHGAYMDDCRVGRVAPFHFDAEGLKVQERVWKELSEKLERIEPGILQNI